MPQRETSWSLSTTVLYTLILTALLLITALAWPWPGGSSMIPVQASVGAAPPPTATAHGQLAASTAPDEPPIRHQAQPAPPPTKPDFAKCIHELCELARRTANLAQQDEIEAAKATDGNARERFAELMAAFPDAGERSLAMLLDDTLPTAESDGVMIASVAPVDPPPVAGEPGQTTAAPIDHARRIVLQMVLQADLARRHDIGRKVDDRTRIDSLVQATLDSMPMHAIAAEVGGAVLADQPYLRLTHEPAVLELLRLAGERSFPRDIATKLLLTLWDNLQEFGERSSTEMSQLALLLLDDSDPSQIIAACRQLLVDARYRALALSWLRERRDPELAGAIAQLASRELPPEHALDVLRELTPLLRQARGTYLGLGVRAPGLLADAYREHLAANNRPAVRRELVMGVGMLPQADGLAIAELALANDPSPEVRIQAMFVFTVRAEGEQAERAVERVLDDPVIAGSQQHLGAVVLALQNLEGGDPNVVARLGRRLQSLPLATESRLLLGEILARALPGGAPSNVARPGK